MKKQLADIEQKLPTADPLSRVLLIQQRIDLQQELESKSATVDLGSLEADFVKAAKEYGARKGITYAAWREAGVPPQILRKAGIGRAS